MTERMNENNKDKVLYMTQNEFKEVIQGNYAREIGDMNPDDLYDNYNPGPTLPDGNINFECHCVSHLVASPCGHEFREAITCQKASTEKELENGSCADEFIRFMECVIRTDCFRSRGNESESDYEKKKNSILKEKFEESRNNLSSKQNTLPS